MLSILQRSAGISWPLAPDAPEEELAAAAVAMPGGRPGAPVAAAAVGPASAAAGPLGAAEPLALPFAVPDAAAVAVERPGVAALPGASRAWARPMGWILEALR
jgi:hypothetical protein